MLVLHIKAPFGAFRAFSAGSYRQSSPFITPSAAYGLVLGLAGIETRGVEKDSEIATGTAPELPSIKIAVGMVASPEVGVVLQQLHNYPIGNTGKEHAAATFGSKYNIQPIKREVLVGIDGYIAVDASSKIENDIREALSTGLDKRLADGSSRYGIPFLGDNAFMIDSLKIVESALKESRWYCPVDIAQDDDGPRPGICRMPVWIDRNDMSKTKTMLFAPTSECTDIPTSAWIEVIPPAEINIVDVDGQTPTNETPSEKKNRGRKPKPVVSD